MKAKIILSAIAFGLALTTTAQDLKESEVPSGILETFKKDHPNVRAIDWERDGAFYKVEFKHDTRDHEVWYDDKGKVFRTKEDVTAAELPDAVAAAIKKGYSQFKAEDFEKWTEGRAVTYKIELKSSAEDRNVIFDKNGQVLVDVID
jgi:hypothetical protein